MRRVLAYCHLSSEGQEGPEWKAEDYLAYFSDGEVTVVLRNGFWKDSLGGRRVIEVDLEPVTDD